MIISLSSCQWRIRGYWPYTPLFGRSMETGAEMGAVTNWMPATVPGCVMNDLLACGVVEDPYYEMNSLKCEWAENRWWVYRTEFTVDESLHEHDIALVFSGVDYKCHIFLNGVKLAEHEGMFEPIRLNITGKARFGAVNALEVVIESAPDEMGQIGYTSRVRTQTSRFGYKWDYSTRMVHAGIWQDVFLEATPGARIAEAQVMTSVEENRGVADVHLALEFSGNRRYRVEAALSLDGKPVALKEMDAGPDAASAALRLEVTEPRLWWPAGYGEQSLYDLSVRLWLAGTLCDEYSSQVGIRSLEYEHNEGAPDALPYVVKFNGTRIYLRGANISPLDHMIGSVGEPEYERIVGLASGMHANVIRVWGGGVTEKEAFYRLCDRQGMLVWQEFNQSSSGIDNIPPKDEAFLALIKRNATASLKARRNHVCLVLWNGGNELMDEQGVPSTYGDPNIAMLKALANELDPQRPFLPTSASGPREFLDVSMEARGGNHDVHGPWQYQGPARQYEMYNQSDSLLHSEFGVDGFTNASSALRFLSKENLVPSSAAENLVWRHHGEWWDTTARDRSLFGEAGSLERMIACSQFIQAEGLRYAVESNRRRAFQNSGSIIWQLNEPWPNLFNTCLVDYYGQPKGAYWWVKRAYAPLAVSLRYDRLVFEPGSDFRAEAWVSDNACAYEGQVDYRVLDMAGQARLSGSFEVCCSGRHSVRAGKIEFPVDGFLHGFFLAELSADGLNGPNQYIFSCNGAPAFAPLLADCTCPGLEVSVMEENRVLVRNSGELAALFARLEAPGAAFEDNGFHLMPGESRLMRYSGDLRGGVSMSWLNRSGRLT